MSELTGSQRKQLRKLAHRLSPVAAIGKQGLTDAVVDAVDQALADHELIKLKFADFKNEKEALSQQLAERTKSHCVGQLGNITILYRQHPVPKQRQISLAPQK